MPPPPSHTPQPSIRWFRAAGLAAPLTINRTRLLPGARQLRSQHPQIGGAARMDVCLLAGLDTSPGLSRVSLSDQPPLRPLNPLEGQTQKRPRPELEAQRPLLGVIRGVPQAEG